MTRSAWLKTLLVLGPLGCAPAAEEMGEMTPNPGAAKEPASDKALSAMDTTLRVWRPSDGVWYERDTRSGAQVGTQFGAPLDIPVRMDRTGDGVPDHVIFRPSNGGWYVRGGETQFWGRAGDVPVAGDYDGDRIDDFAIWRPTDGTWHISKSADGSVEHRQFGQLADVPIPGDYDGDGRTDIGVWRPGDGHWYVIRSSDGTLSDEEWGVAGDRIAQGDYDGDGRLDRAIFRPSDGNWWVKRSSDGAHVVTQWGMVGDVPVPLDYDTDGFTDVAVWRPSDGIWYIRSSSTGGWTWFQWGASNDVPLGYRSLGTEGEDFMNPTIKKKAIHAHFHPNSAVTRWLETACAKRCVTPGPGGTCAQYQDDCTPTGAVSIKLLEKKDSPLPFPAKAIGNYRGCGPQAAANLGSYVLGYDLQVQDVRDYTNVWIWPLWADEDDEGVQIGTTPDRLVESIARTLNLDLHRYNIVKKHEAELEEIHPYLARGFPVIVMSKGGNHYYTVTGYRAPDQYFVTDYLGGDGGQWLTHEQIRYDHIDVNLAGFQGYHWGTFIAIDGFSN